VPSLRTWTGSGLQSVAHPTVVLRDLDMRALFTLIAQGDGHNAIGFADARARVQRYTQRDFVRRAAAMRSLLFDAGVDAGDNVAVACPSPEVALTAYIGCVLHGARPVLFASRPGFDSRERVAENLGALLAQVPGNALTLVQSDSGTPALVLPTSFRTTALDIAALEPTDAPPLVRTTPHEIVHLQSTSGSTGTPRLTALTSANVLSNTSSALERMEIDASDRFVSWLPLFHDLGLVGMALDALVAGADLYMLSPFDFAKNPFGWLKTISDVRGTITATPNFGLTLAMRRVSDAQMQSIDLSSLRRLYCGAEPIDGRLAAQFIDRFARAGLPRESVRPTYGLAEATLMVAMPTMNERSQYVTLDARDVARVDRVQVTRSGNISDLLEEPAAAGEAIVVSVGQPGPGTIVRIVDENNKLVDEDQKCGEIVVAGPSVTPGYLLPDGSIEQFDPLGLRTGDVGFWYHGDLFVVERIKNTIIRNGHNYAPNVLELELARRSDVPIGDIAIIDSDLRPGVGRIIAAICLPKGRTPTSVIESATDMARTVEPPLEEIVFLQRTAMPRTTSGKKRYHALRGIVGDLTDDRVVGRVPLGATSSLPELVIEHAPEHEESAPPVIDIDRIDKRYKAQRIIQDAARARNIRIELSDDARFVEDLHFDSLALYEVAVNLELGLDIIILESALAEVTTVGELLNLSGGASVGAGVRDRLARLVESIPQAYRVIEEQRDRQLLIDGRWITDFASLNYLGLDLDKRVIGAVAPLLEKWGTHPSWTRAVGSPLPYRRLERDLATLVGAADTVVFPSISLLHFGMLPKLAGTGTILIDDGAHTSILEAAELAQARGADVVTVRSSDPADMERKLEASRDGVKIIAADGVYSMSGNIPPLRAYDALAEKYGALLYIDDAHGVGVLGHDPSPEHPFGRGGSGVMRHLGLDYRRTFYIGGMSKAFSSMAAFITCRDANDRRLAETASTMIFSGPIPVASLATGIEGLRVNTLDGDQRRAHLWNLTDRVLRSVRELGFTIDNNNGFPCVTVICGEIDATIRAHQVLWKHGILVTPAVFPAMPIDRGGVRISITAANTDDEVDQLIAAFAELSESIIAPYRSAGQVADPSPSGP
jgi:8-amino-7-oxononanoate synthase